MGHRTRLKICCIASVAEAHAAIGLGADALGLVGRMPSGPGVIDDGTIRGIAESVPPPISTFLLTSETEPGRVVEHARSTRVSTVQIVDDGVEQGVHEALRKELPAVRIVQVIHVVGDESVDKAIASAPLVDAILLDSGNPAAAKPELGGTGRVHDWSLSKAIVDGVDRPIFLAGGLHPDNIAEAVRQVRPFGVDLCSGIRTNGALDPIKAKAFVAALRSASDS